MLSTCDGSADVASTVSKLSNSEESQNTVIVLNTSDGPKLSELPGKVEW